MSLYIGKPVDVCMKVVYPFVTYMKNNLKRERYSKNAGYAIKKIPAKYRLVRLIGISGLPKQKSILHKAWLLEINY